MKKALLAATAITLISTSAIAENQWPFWYLGLSGGVAQQGDSDWDQAGASGKFEYDTGYSVNVALGYRPNNSGTFFDSSRVELEFSYRNQQFDGVGDKADADTRVASLNYYYDFAPESGVNPYFGAGLGYGAIDIGETNAAGVDGKDNAFTYQLMAGLGFQFQEMPQTEWTLGYRYFAPFSDIEIDSTEIEFDTHTVEAGARFRF